MLFLKLWPDGASFVNSFDDSFQYTVTYARLQYIGILECSDETKGKILRSIYWIELCIGVL